MGGIYKESCKSPVPRFGRCPDLEAVTDLEVLYLRDNLHFFGMLCKSCFRDSEPPSLGFLSGLQLFRDYGRVVRGAVTPLRGSIEISLTKTVDCFLRCAKDYWYLDT